MSVLHQPNDVAVITPIAPPSDTDSVGQQRRSSFYWAMRVMPKAKREAMLALYDFCRAADDAVDEAPDRATALGQLAYWREEVEAMIQGTPSHPISQALAPHIARYGMKEQYFHDMLDGFAKDAEGQMLFPILDQLDQYLYAVASCVGLLSLPIFGAEGEADRAFAYALGKGLQCINIVRDIEEDATRGRCYLPKEWASEASIDTLLVDQNALRHAAEKMLEKAQTHLHEAEQHYSQSTSRSALRPARMMKLIYVDYWKQLSHDMRQNCDRLPRCQMRWWHVMWLFVTSR